MTDAKIDVAALADCVKRAVFEVDHFEGRVSAASATTLTAALPALLRVLKAARWVHKAYGPDFDEDFINELGDALSAFDFGGDDE